MATLNEIARSYADEIRDGIAWVLVWKTGRSWNATAVWLNPDTDTFEPDDLDTAREILKQDPNAVMLNGYYCGHFGEGMTVKELAAGIRWHYEGGYNTLDGSTAFPPEPAERPADLPANVAWYDSPAAEAPDPYVFDGHMSPEDYELRHQEKLREEKPPDTEATAQALREGLDRVAQAIREIGDRLREALTPMIRLACEAVNKFFDALLYAANDNPKWWHLYKHAKKARTRKKYRRRLVRQLVAKLAAGG